MLYTPSYGNSQLKMEILEFTSKEAAAPLMSVAAPLWFWKFWRKKSRFWNFFSEILNFRNNAANHTPKLGVEPGLDPPVTARVKVTCVEGLDVVDPLVGSVADVFLIACEECVDACVGKQSDVVVANNFSRSQQGENF